MRRIDYSSRIERCTERSVRITGTRAEALDEERFHVSRDASFLPARSGVQQHDSRTSFPRLHHRCSALVVERVQSGGGRC